METILREFIRESVESHLKSRGVDPERTQVVVDEESGTATFLLFNLSGQLVGYQQYTPDAPKERNNDPFGRYFTFRGMEGDLTRRKGQKKIAVWGLESTQWDDPYVFITEGIFDAVKIQNAGRPAIAILSNAGPGLRAWFKALGKFVIVIEDNDAAGAKLSNPKEGVYLGDHSVTVPDPYKDLGDMPQEEATAFVNRILEELGVHLVSR